MSAGLEALVKTAVDFLQTRKRIDNDAGPALLVMRDDAVIALLESGETKILLDLAAIAASGLAAEALAFAMEGVMPIVPENPMTGRAWAAGEADNAWADHDGVAKGWVSEVLVFSLASRSGEVVDLALLFRTDNGEVSWHGEPLSMGGSSLSAALGRQLVHPVIDAAQVRDPGDKMTASDSDPFMSEKQGRIWLDVGAARMLGRKLPRGVSLVVSDGDRAAELTAQGLPVWQTLRNPA